MHGVCLCAFLVQVLMHIRYMSQETLRNPTNSVEILRGFSADFVKLPCS